MADSITDLFMKRQPSMQDVSSALWRSLASQKVSKPGSGVSFGETLNNIRGAKIKEARQFEGVKQSRQRLSQGERRLDLDEMKFELEQTKVQNKPFHDAWERETKNVSLIDKRRLWKRLKDSPQDMSQGDPRTHVYNAMDELGIKERGPAPKAPGIGMKQLDVPTGEVDAMGQPVYA